MSNIKETLKNVGKHVWELFKASVPAGLMFLCASLVLLVLTLKGEKIEWNNTNLLWSLACGLGGLAYTGLVMWANGGQHYEMLVSGNMKRIASGGMKISSHKEEKEYRPWRGFVCGAVIAIFTVLAGILMTA